MAIKDIFTPISEVINHPITKTTGAALGFAALGASCADVNTNTTVPNVVVTEEHQCGEPAPTEGLYFPNSTTSLTFPNNFIFANESHNTFVVANPNNGQLFSCDFTKTGIVDISSNPGNYTSNFHALTADAEGTNIQTFKVYSNADDRVILQPTDKLPISGQDIFTSMAVFRPEQDEREALILTTKKNIDGITSGIYMYSLENHFLARITDLPPTHSEIIDIQTVGYLDNGKKSKGLMATDEEGNIWTLDTEAAPEEVLWKQKQLEFRDGELHEILSYSLKNSSLVILTADGFYETPILEDSQLTKSHSLNKAVSELFSLFQINSFRNIKEGSR